MNTTDICLLIYSLSIIIGFIIGIIDIVVFKRGKNMKVEKKCINCENYDKNLRECLRCDGISNFELRFELKDMCLNSDGTYTKNNNGEENKNED